jgi:nitrite reductase/ring-hydroxylating ferredoxin subunit
MCPNAMSFDGPARRLVEIGTVADFPKDGVYERWADKGFFVVRSNGRLYAESSVCTHKPARLVVREKQLVCAKHGSRFSWEGQVVRGPARRALARFKIAMSGSGTITVDVTSVFEEGRWDDPESHIKIA